MRLVFYSIEGRLRKTFLGPGLHREDDGACASTMCVYIRA
jgi:hypothetical protein